MLRIFQSSNPLSLLLLIAYAALVNLKWILHPELITMHEMSFVSTIIFIQWLHIEQLPKYIVIICNLALIITTGIVSSFLMQQYKLITKASLIPAATFITLCSLFPENLLNPPEIISGLVLIWIFFKIFSTYNKTKVSMAYFDVGLLSGIISLLFYPAIVLLFFGIIALFRMRSTSLRDFFNYCLGYLLCYFLVATLMFWFDLLPQFAGSHFKLPFAVQPNAEMLTILASVKLGLVGLVAIAAIIFFVDKMSTNLIQIRKYQGVAVWFFMFALLIFSFNLPFQAISLYHLILAVSLFVSYYFYHFKNRLVTDIVFLTLLGTTLLFQYINFAA